MNRSWQRFLPLLGCGALASQAGHLLVYQLQFGSAAQSVQSTGVHSYFPVLAKTSLGLAALAVVGSLLIIGASRLLTNRPGSRILRGPSYLSLLATLFTIQLTCFVLQETIESGVAGTAVASAPHLFLLGTLGQLPIAAVAALAFKWLSVRVESSISTLRAVLATKVMTFGSIATVLAPPALIPQLALAAACPAAYVKRGPPRFLRS